MKTVRFKLKKPKFNFVEGNEYTLIHYDGEKIKGTFISSDEDEYGIVYNFISDEEEIEIYEENIGTNEIQII